MNNSTIENIRLLGREESLSLLPGFTGLETAAQLAARVTILEQILFIRTDRGYCKLLSKPFKNDNMRGFCLTVAHQPA